MISLYSGTPGSGKYKNYLDLYMDVVSNFSAEYEDIFCANSGHFERLLRANYLKNVRKMK